MSTVTTTNVRFFRRPLSAIAKLSVVILCLAPVLSVNAETALSDAAISRPVTIYKSPSCGCCEEWVKHIEQAGFTTRIQHPDNLNEIKEQLAVAPLYQACHTAVAQGYVFEGHIPAVVMQRFLAEAPGAALGLAVPGMPLGSPGMDTDQAFRPYKVLRLNKDGSSTPYARVAPDNITYEGK
jgi:hypothetical protein